MKALRKFFKGSSHATCCLHTVHFVDFFVVVAGVVIGDVVVGVPDGGDVAAVVMVGVSGVAAVDVRVTIVVSVDVDVPPVISVDAVMVVSPMSSTLSVLLLFLAGVYGFSPLCHASYFLCKIR